MANVSEIQDAIGGLVQAGTAAADPFIKSKGGKATEAKVLGEVQLGVQLLPTLGSLFHLIGSLFHHAHAAATTPPTK